MWVLILDSIVRYTVASLLLPFKSAKPGGSCREIRINGTTCTFQEVASAWGKARGVTYKTIAKPGAVALAEQEKAAVAGDLQGELSWSILHVIGSGFAVADDGGAKLDNDLFDFVPEKMGETFRRISKDYPVLG